MEIHTARLSLREMTEDDFDFFEEMETNEACLRYESDSVPTQEAIDEKFRRTLEDKNKAPRARYRWVVCTQSAEEPIGRVVLWQIDEAIREWEIGWDVHPAHWGKGYAPEAAQAVLQFAFRDLKVHRVQALCNDENVNSEKVMIKIGMKKEGTCRGVRLLNNCWYGSHIYSLLENEFDAIAKI